ncbi:DoxX family protein [Pseudomonas fluorescens]|uniref:LysR family transcriptional regulator n=1 Tax=Pseudomonas fluorescens TaxID=294 RepID=A0A0F4V652_PSEFL|nr:DoxX family protein [Pseudomonas fluorescens]KJZ63965.1 LysR family transcriptional regulator [Pseudomonas fluorescens]
MSTSRWDERAQNFGLFFLRVSGGLFLLWVHGLPKLLNYSTQLQTIEDPFHLGANVTLMLAIFAEVLCPLLIVAGVFVRLACLPILCVLLIALLIVHPQWSLDEGQFGWLLMMLFTGLLIAGPGRLALNVRFPGVLRYA